ncbi:MAG: relaxase domain-containing protein, partial [Rhodospirillales bacterium]|nr:relaxase domain-containing protein [Rhodospirillales bacterium]
YYAGQERAPTPADGLVRLVNEGVLSYSEAEGALVGALLGRPENRDVDPDLLEARAINELKEAMARHDEGLGLASPHAVTIKVQPDIDPAVTDVLGVGGKRTLTVDEHANFLSALRADDGGVIPGKERHKAMISIVEAFGLNPRAPPEGDAVHNVLAGRRADGEAPHTPKGEPLSQAAIAGARRRYLSMMGVPSGREPTPEEIGHLVEGRTAGGLGISASDYRRKANNKNESIAYVELVFAPDKTVSISWALARTEAERAAWMQVHEDAVLVAMRYSQTVLGHAGIGKNRDGGTEPAKLGWVGATHFTSRPTVETIAYDAEGRAYTEPREVPVAAAPQLHTHVNIANVLRTESGRLTSIDLDRLDGEVAAIRSVYQAGIARGARA